MHRLPQIAHIITVFLCSFLWSALAPLDFSGPYFHEMAHNFSKSGAFGPFVYFPFPISATSPEVQEGVLTLKLCGIQGRVVQSWVKITQG